MIKFVLQDLSGNYHSKTKVKDVYGYRSMDNGVYFYYHTQHDNVAWELFSNTPEHDNHFIQIEENTYQSKEILKNPERIFALMQQDSINDSLDKLPG